MAGRLNTFSARMVMVIIVIHAISMPLLYFGLVAVVKKGLVDGFIDEIRIYSRVLADNFEGMVVDVNEGEIVAMLDSLMLSGQSTYAVLEINGEVVTSSLMAETESGRFQEDFSFGEHDDQTYYLSMPMVTGPSMGFLRMGFDESPIEDRVEEVRQTILNVLLTYMVAVVLLTVALSSGIVRPIKRLKALSRQIATGDYDQTMDVDTGVFEVRELALDLEAMRSNLVGINARLQSEIHERETAEASKKDLESKLRHAQRLESLGTLAGGVAHEFNNVLQPLLLYTDLAIEDIPGDSPARRSLERVLELAHDAKGLSQQILTFGRIEGEGDLQSIDLGPVVDEALAMVSALLPATIDIRGTVDADVGLVRCDRRQIQQLIVNLCSNAFQSLEKGSEHIEIRYYRSFVSGEDAARHASLRAGNHAVIEVSDTGRGMSEATLQRAFEPFYTTQDVGEGTGLGLSVVHGIVQRHKGEVVVKSRIGEGTRFRVYLPIRTD